MIEVKNMNFAYSKKRTIFENLSLTLKGGHIYGLLGKNGAGKTTLLKNMAGLRFPQSGSCTVLGMESKERKAEMLEEIYFLPEEIWLPEVTVSGYLNLYAGSYPKFDYQIFDRCLSEFEINSKELLKHMSFGQRKKVAISFALATQCKILIFDEPTNGLDIPSKGQFRKLAAEVINDERCLILSTHQVRDLECLIDTVIILDNSEVLLNNTTEQICDKLVFKTLLSLENQQGILYSEFTPRGYIAVFENTEAFDSRIDLEVLFNMSTQHPALIKHLFNL
jgi:ABC-type multidrug transport system, ATPase component